MYIPSNVEYCQARTSTISMPYRVQQIEEIVKQLESGDLKLRVRVLEVISLIQIISHFLILLVKFLIQIISHFPILLEIVIFLSLREQLEKLQFFKWQPCTQS